MIKKIWKDPVWSKVIAAGIIFVLGAKPDLLLWIFVIFLIFRLKPMISFVRGIFNKISNPQIIKSHLNKIPFATEPSTVLFSYRMAQSFPGLRGLAWFNRPSEAIKRLQILLKEPLRFENDSMDYESDPIWWFRGHSALNIERFEKLGRRRVLMGYEQLKIKRIAAFYSNSYCRDFVYVETFAEKQTGLYGLKKAEIKWSIEKFGYSREEYGLIRNLYFWKKPISREQYDDGATIIRGNVVNANDAELRVRYLSDYNFIIAAKGSPYNSSKFCRDSRQYLDGILTGEIEFDDFFKFMQNLNKNE